MKIYNLSIRCEHKDVPEIEELAKKYYKEVLKSPCTLFDDPKVNAKFIDIRIEGLRDFMYRSFNRLMKYK